MIHIPWIPWSFVKYVSVISMFLWTLSLKRMYLDPVYLVIKAILRQNVNYQKFSRYRRERRRRSIIKSERHTNLFVKYKTFSFVSSHVCNSIHFFENNMKITLFTLSVSFWSTTSRLIRKLFPTSKKTIQICYHFILSMNVACVGRHCNLNLRIPWFLASCLLLKHQP